MPPKSAVTKTYTSYAVSPVGKLVSTVQARYNTLKAEYSSEAAQRWLQLQLDLIAVFNETMELFGRGEQPKLIAMRGRSLNGIKNDFTEQTKGFLLTNGFKFLLDDNEQAVYLEEKKTLPPEPAKKSVFTKTPMEVFNAKYQTIFENKLKEVVAKVKRQQEFSLPDALSNLDYIPLQAYLSLRMAQTPVPVELLSALEILGDNLSDEIVEKAKWGTFESAFSFLNPQHIVGFLDERFGPTLRKILESAMQGAGPEVVRPHTLTLSPVENFPTRYEMSNLLTGNAHDSVVINVSEKYQSFLAIVQNYHSSKNTRTMVASSDSSNVNGLAGMLGNLASMIDATQDSPLGTSTFGKMLLDQFSFLKRFVSSLNTLESVKTAQILFFLQQDRFQVARSLSLKETSEMMRTLFTIFKLERADSADSFLRILGLNTKDVIPLLNMYCVLAKEISAENMLRSVSPDILHAFQTTFAFIAGTWLLNHHFDVHLVSIDLNDLNHVQLRYMIRDKDGVEHLQERSIDLLKLYKAHVQDTLPDKVETPEDVEVVYSALKALVENMLNGMRSLENNEIEVQKAPEVTAVATVDSVGSGDQGETPYSSVHAEASDFSGNSSPVSDYRNANAQQTLFDMEYAQRQVILGDELADGSALEFQTLYALETQSDLEIALDEKNARDALHDVYTKEAPPLDEFHGLVETQERQLALVKQNRLIRECKEKESAARKAISSILEEQHERVVIEQQEFLTRFQATATIVEQQAINDQMNMLTEESQRRSRIERTEGWNREVVHTVVEESSSATILEEQRERSAIEQLEKLNREAVHVVEQSNRPTITTAPSRPINTPPSYNLYLRILAGVCVTLAAAAIVVAFLALDLMAFNPVGIGVVGVGLLLTGVGFFSAYKSTPAIEPMATAAVQP